MDELFSFLVDLYPSERRIVSNLISKLFYFYLEMITV